MNHERVTLKALHDYSETPEAEALNAATLKVEGQTFHEVIHDAIREATGIVGADAQHDWLNR